MRINLTTNVQTLYEENYKIFPKDIKEVPKNEEMPFIWQKNYIPTLYQTPKQIPDVLKISIEETKL